MIDGGLNFLLKLGHYLKMSLLDTSLIVCSNGEKPAAYETNTEN
jgi:hypothetical protein